MTRFVVQIDMEIEADSIEYLEERSAELEEIVTLHFDQGELVGFGVDVFEGTADEDDEDGDSDGSDDDEYGTYDDDESEVDDEGH